MPCGCPKPKKSCGGCGSGSSSAAAVSAMEKQMRNAKKPVSASGSETINVNGESGIWLNKEEVENWSGDLPIDQYKFFKDPNPEVLNKKIEGVTTNVQKIQVKYLEPPSVGGAGDIVIEQQPDCATGPAPPVILRQGGGCGCTPEPLVIRENPPCPPTPPGPKHITIPGKKQPPPPRKVIIEKMPSEGDKPQDIIVERWLPYKAGGERRVVFKAAPGGSGPQNPRNLVIVWEAGETKVKKQEQHESVQQMDPDQYRQQYGDSLTDSGFPSLKYKHKLAADSGAASGKYTLTGDLEALCLIDLDAEGLSEYKSQVKCSGGSGSSSGSGCGCKPKKPKCAPKKPKCPKKPSCGC